MMASETDHDSERLSRINCRCIEHAQYVPRRSGKAEGEGRRGAERNPVFLGLSPTGLT